MSNQPTSFRLKTSTLRNHRSVAALDTSNPNYKSSPVRATSRKLNHSPKSNINTSNKKTTTNNSIKRSSSTILRNSSKSSPRIHIVNEPNQLYNYILFF
jgi:hypothetical protein